jgi:hypothetical protein
MHAASTFIQDPGRALAFSLCIAGLVLSAFFWLTERWERRRGDDARALARGLRERMNRLRGQGPFAPPDPDPTPGEDASHPYRTQQIPPATPETPGP